MKKLSISIFALFLIICCSIPKPNPSVSMTENRDQTPFDSVFTTFSQQDFKLKYDTIIKVGQSTFRLFKDTGDSHLELRFKMLKKNNGVWQQNLDLEWTSLQIFKDWNQDGYMDIVLQYHFAFDILLFNPQKQAFVDFGKIGEKTDEVVNIEGTNLKYNLDEYLTYWHSELFDIDSNYNMRSYGIMVNWDENFDDTNRERQFICVYKRNLVYNAQYRNNLDSNMMGTNKALIERFDPEKLRFQIDTTSHFDSLKAAFVKEYWHKNWQKYVTH